MINQPANPTAHPPTQHPPSTDANRLPPHLLSELPSEISRLTHTLVQRRLGRAALLFLAGHQPLAFFAGQCLHMLSPAYRLLMADTVAEHALDEWADLLSRPDGLHMLEPLLLDDPLQRS